MPARDRVPQQWAAGASLVNLYVLTRCLESLVAVWGVLTIVFVAARLTGDPAVLLLPIGATDDQLDALRRDLGLDRSLPEQYVLFLADAVRGRSEEHTSELQSLMRLSYAVFCLKKKNRRYHHTPSHSTPLRVNRPH